MSQIYPGFWRGGLPTRQTPRMGRRNRARTFIFGDNGGAVIYGSDGRNWKSQVTGLANIVSIATFGYSVVGVRAAGAATRGTKDLRAGVWADVSTLFSSVQIAASEQGYVDGYSTPSDFLDHNFQVISAQSAQVGDGTSGASGRILSYHGRLRGRGLFRDGGLTVGVSSAYGYQISGWAMSTDFYTIPATTPPFSAGLGDIPICNGLSVHTNSGANGLTVLDVGPNFRSVVQFTTTALTPAFTTQQGQWVAAGNGVILTRNLATGGFAISRDCLNWQLVDLNAQTGKSVTAVVLWNGECFAAGAADGSGMVSSFDGYNWTFTPIATTLGPLSGVVSDYVIP